MPAALVVVSSVHGKVLSVTVNTASPPAIPALADAVIFVPDQVFTAAPKTWTCSVSTIVCVVVVVEFILPVVN